jgi:hypothetical protein
LRGRGQARGRGGARRAARRQETFLLAASPAPRAFGRTASPPPAGAPATVRPLAPSHAAGHPPRRARGRASRRGCGATWKTCGPWATSRAPWRAPRRPLRAAAAKPLRRAAAPSAGQQGRCLFAGAGTPASGLAPLLPVAAAAAPSPAACLPRSILQTAICPLWRHCRARALFFAEPPPLLCHFQGLKSTSHHIPSHPLHQHPCC